MSEMRGTPNAVELAEAVREFLGEEVMPAVDERLRFRARVAANVLAQLERELVEGPAREERQQERLAGLGVADDHDFARAIRAGELDDRPADVLAALRADAIERLRITNPRYLRPEDREDAGEGASR